MPIRPTSAGSTGTWPTQELAALYGLADCYVHPSRGEGFGLPVAEAMLAGVPVISVAWSGLADFVSEETAVTVPYTLVAAESHLAERGLAVGRAGRRGPGRRAGPAWPPTPTPRSRPGGWSAPGGSSPRSTRGRRPSVGGGRSPTRSRTRSAAAGWPWSPRGTRGAASPRTAATSSSTPATRWPTTSSPTSTPRSSIRPPSPAWCGPGRTAGRPSSTPWRTRSLVSEADVLHVQFNFGFFEFGRLAELLDRQLGRRGVVLDHASHPGLRRPGHPAHPAPDPGDRWPGSTSSSSTRSPTPATSPRWASRTT